MKISELFGANVPRYTSYPTAPHFHAGIGPATYEAWLADLPENAPLSLYVHIPFCDTLCWFCGCHTAVVNNYAPVLSYCAWLEREIELVARYLKGRHPVTHIHWGGGSPTMLQPAQIESLNRTIRGQFDVAADAEFAIEIDPRGLTPACVQALARAGVTRASIGLQDCDPQVQRAINRIQSEQETMVAVSLLRAVGITSINVDIIYGLPHQTLAKWENTLDFALSLDPDRLAVFGYAHVPKFKKHQALIPTASLPGLEERFHQAELAREILCGHGYQSIGLDHYAKPSDSLAKAATEGRLHRNFQGYTTDTSTVLLGVGASAIGSLPQGYIQNHSAVPAYRAALEAGLLPVTRGVALSDDDRMRRQVIERLMCDLKVDLDDIAVRFGHTRDAFSDSLHALEPLRQDNVIAMAGGTITVNPRWRSAVRIACAAFDQYLVKQAALHSASV